jgi:hypothetical protein
LKREEGKEGKTVIFLSASSLAPWPCKRRQITTVKAAEAEAEAVSEWRLRMAVRPGQTNPQVRYLDYLQQNFLQDKRQ